MRLGLRWLQRIPMRTGNHNEDALECVRERGGEGGLKAGILSAQSAFFYLQLYTQLSLSVLRVSRE